MNLKKMLQEAREKTAKLYKEMKSILEKAGAENRDLTDDERTKYDGFDTEWKAADADVTRLDEMVKREERMNATINAPPPDGDDPATAVTEQDDAPVYRGNRASSFGQQLVDVYIVGAQPGDAGITSEVRKAAQSRIERNSKRALTLIEKRQGHAPSKEFVDRSMAPVYNPEARTAGTGMNQGIASEGGILLQSETSIDLMTSGFGNSTVLSRCQKRTITGSESLEIIGVDETSRADGSRGGGVRVYPDAELSQMTSSATKLNKIKLAPERLTGLYYASDKILMNATFLGQEMKQLFEEEFAFKTQDLVMEGTGAGQALGLKSAGCKIDIGAEAGQAADTIVTENVLNMLMRFHIRGGDGSVCWLANRNIYKELRTMTYDVGTGGELAKLYNPPRNPGESGSMEGYPLFFIEQAESLGDAGDLWLVDLNQYICVDYGDINEASSMHFKFDYSQMTFRFVYHFDGQPRLVSAITPFKGSSSTVSPFVRIEAR